MNEAQGSLLPNEQSPIKIADFSLLQIPVGTPDELRSTIRHINDFQQFNEVLYLYAKRAGQQFDALKGISSWNEFDESKDKVQIMQELIQLQDDNNQVKRLKELYDLAYLGVNLESNTLDSSSADAALLDIAKNVFLTDVNKNGRKVVVKKNERGESEVEITDEDNGHTKKESHSTSEVLHQFFEKLQRTQSELNERFSLGIAQNNDRISYTMSQTEAENYFRIMKAKKHDAQNGFAAFVMGVDNLNRAIKANTRPRDITEYIGPAILACQNTRDILEGTRIRAPIGSHVLREFIEQEFKTLITDSSIKSGLHNVTYKWTEESFKVEWSEIDIIRLFGNIAQNAARAYTAMDKNVSRGIEVDVNIEEIDGKEWLDICIKDHAIGFSQDIIEKQRFPGTSRWDDQKKVHGEGVGMKAAEDDFYEYNDGRKFMFANNPEGGASFTIRLPTTGDNR